MVCSDVAAGANLALVTRVVWLLRYVLSRKTSPAFYDLSYSFVARCARRTHCTIAFAMEYMIFLHVQHTNLSSLWVLIPPHRQQCQGHDRIQARIDKVNEETTQLRYNIAADRERLRSCL